MHVLPLLDRINAECCDEPGEDCSGGAMHTCNEGCAALVRPRRPSARPPRARAPTPRAIRRVASFVRLYNIQKNQAGPLAVNFTMCKDVLK